jgi:hypothetical protein
MNNSLKIRQVVRGMSQFLSIALLLVSCCALAAQDEAHRVRILSWFTALGPMVRAGKAFTTS